MAVETVDFPSRPTHTAECIELAALPPVVQLANEMMKHAASECMMRINDDGLETDETDFI